MWYGAARLLCCFHNMAHGKGAVIRCGKPHDFRAQISFAAPVFFG
jgi:hypothetical protein